MNKKARLIGLTGTNGSGKGEAASFFVKKGYAYLSLSDIIRDELRNKGQEITRDNLIRMGNTMREEFSPDILAQKIMKKAKGKAVIDSIRNPKEVEYLRKQEGFILLAIDAPPKIRYERVKKRGREESVLTLQEFIAKEAEEMSTVERSQQLQVCMKMADFTIQNNGTLQELHKKLEKLL
jgi:dephospho-CoA kinase